MRRILTIMMAACISVMPAVSVSAVESAWETELSVSMKWSMVTYFGTLLVGGDKGLSMINPETGELMWTRDDVKKLASFDVKEVTGYPVLILGKDKGMGGSKAEVEAIDMTTGETKWSTDQINGQPLGVYAVPGKAQVLLVVNVYYDDDRGSGIFIISYDAESGKQLWETKYHEKAGGITPYLADNSGAFYARMDFSGYQDPVFEDNTAYLTFKGIHALDLTTGQIKWEKDFRTYDKKFKKAYASPVIDGNIIYATGGGVIYAINKLTGDLLWETDRVRSGLVGQLEIGANQVFARIGGNFFNPGARMFSLDKPLLVNAYNKETGEMIWQYKGARGSLTNMTYLADQKVLFLADATRLIGLEVTGEGNVDEKFSVPLKFKRSIGGVEAVSLGAKALTGGLGGLLSGAVKTAVGDDRKDPPVAVIPQANGSVVVRGQQHILSFNPQTEEIDWSVFYAAPGPSMLSTALVTGVSAFAALGYQAQYASGNMSAGNASNAISGQFQRMDKYLAKRFSKSTDHQSHAYVLTTINDENEKGIGVVAINLQTGETDNQFVFAEKQPEYAVDAVGGRVYYFPKKRAVKAFDL